jgi:hypothetical protein
MERYFHPEVLMLMGYAIDLHEKLTLSADHFRFWDSVLFKPAGMVT